MNKVNNQLPLAPINCEQMAKKLFPMDMSPEEYAARYCDDWYCFSFHRYYYRDPELDMWIQRLGQIFATPALLAKCQEEMLDSQEINQFRKRLAKGF